MYDCELVMNTLEQVKKLVDTIIERTQTIKDVNDFLCSPDGMVLLDAVCMNLIAVGEATKNLDKVSNGTLLPLFPQVQWNGIMRMRDKIAHHYFEVDAEVVLLTVKEDIPLVKATIQKMIREMNV